jgi:hypothetical protein
MLPLVFGITMEGFSWAPGKTALTGGDVPLLLGERLVKRSVSIGFGFGGVMTPSEPGMTGTFDGPATFPPGMLPGIGGVMPAGLRKLGPTMLLPELIGESGFRGVGVNGTPAIFPSGGIPIDTEGVSGPFGLLSIIMPLCLWLGICFVSSDFIAFTLPWDV